MSYILLYIYTLKTSRANICERKGGHLEDYENKIGLGASHLNNKFTLYQVAPWTLLLRLTMQYLQSEAGLAPPSWRGECFYAHIHPGVCPFGLL